MQRIFLRYVKNDYVPVIKGISLFQTEAMRPGYQ